MINIEELKLMEGQTVNFLYRGKIRPFILQAVQDKKPCNCVLTSEEHINNHLIHGKYQGRKVGEFRLDFAYPNKSLGFRWEGFWTDKIDRIVNIQL